MNAKRIALVGYAPDYFWDFSRVLEEVGFEVYWISALHSHSLFLLKRGVSPRRLLDTSRFAPATYSVSECRARLALLESGDLPRIHDVILMDRILRYRGDQFAIKYLGHLDLCLGSFLSENRITLVTSGRDTALQILSMLVCRKLGVPWVVPTRTRIPQEMYAFCQRHDTEVLLSTRQITSDDYAWARNFLREYNDRAPKPAMKKSAQGFGDVFRLLPIHLQTFAREVKRARYDRGNNFARYTISSLMRKYVQRRFNMLMYVLFPPYSQIGTDPFCLYALHTQPESSIDVVGSYFSDQIALITFIARSLPSTHELYVKVHPTDVDGRTRSSYRRIAAIPGVRLIGHNENSRELVQRASVVFSLTGTIAYEAALLGKPVVTFGKNFFNRLPTVHYCDSPPNLPALISKLIDYKLPPDFNERVTDFLAQVKACSYFGEVNRTYGASTAMLSRNDLVVLREAYLELHEHLVVANRNAIESSSDSPTLKMSTRTM